MSGHNLDAVRDGKVQEKSSEPKIKEPSMYQLVLLNDDYTPMDFVVDLLQKFFGMSMEKATRIMMRVHTEGRGVCGVYTKEIAETRKTQINEYAKANKHILRSVIEGIG